MASEILKMKLQMLINHCMDAGNLTCALNPSAISPALRPGFGFFFFDATSS